MNEWEDQSQPEDRVTRQEERNCLKTKQKDTSHLPEGFPQATGNRRVWVSEFRTERVESPKDLKNSEVCLCCSAERRQAID